MADLLSTTINGDLLITEKLSFGPSKEEELISLQANEKDVWFTGEGTDIYFNRQSLLKPSYLSAINSNVLGENHIVAQGEVVRGVSNALYNCITPYTYSNSDLEMVSQLGLSDNRWGWVMANYGDFKSGVRIGLSASLSQHTAKGRRAAVFIHPGTGAGLEHLHLGSPGQIGTWGYGEDYAHNGNTYIHSRFGQVVFECSPRTDWAQDEPGRAILAPISSTAGNYFGFYPALTMVKKNSSGSTFTLPISLGTSTRRWQKYFGATSSSISSDRRLKNNIKELSNEDSFSIDDFFYGLKPVSYNLNAEEEKQLHIGFIAQGVAESAKEAGIEEKDLAIIDHSFWTDEKTGEEKDEYGLAYEEFIALNTYMIQKQQKHMSQLEQRLEKIEKQISEVK